MVRENRDLIDHVADVRRFNRFVTTRIGALDDRYLSRDRPLGEARLLWEIARGCGDLRDLRRQLDLDSGYLSRLLRALEGAGLVEVGPGSDARTRTARLTDAGRAEYRELEARSEEAALGLLEPLTGSQRDWLVDAMGTVQRLLIASQIVLTPADPGEGDARWTAEQYYRELADRMDGGFDPDIGGAVGDASIVAPRGQLLLAHLQGDPVGCGAFTLLEPEVAEIKRVWVSADVRGSGLGARLLRELEERAAASGAGRVRLDTNGSLHEAISLYRKNGYVEVPPYNDNHHAQLWFEKTLDRRLPPGSTIDM